jgi:hypothetical protein
MPQAGQESTEVIGSQSKPQDLASLDVTSAIAVGSASAPVLEPPVAAKSQEAVGAWLNDKRVNATWCINQNRNAYVAIVGVGWKKLANNSDSAIVALNMLGTHARQMNSPMNYREEADGMIHEMYVW